MRIVDSLPYVASVLLSSMAFGSFAFVVITRWRTDATRGYLGFTAFCAGLLALLTLAIKLGGLLAGTPEVVRTVPADLYLLRQYGLGAFAAAALLYPVFARRARAALVLELVGLVGGSIVLAATAFGWAAAAVDGVPLLVQLVVLSLATGGSLAAVILGHWYLVTPKISEGPLVLQARLVLGVIGLQVLLFVVWTTLGGGPGQGAFDAFTGGNLLLVVLRLIVTLLFPLVLTWMAWRTALTRSMESATGLLYINLAAVMAGTIGAAALYLSSRLLL
ncbi:MAG: hypothetical protein QOJ81_1292 [Chloroflexota bacterium]|jgi:hypothetical protein|nr:hypothetical protein [Chloroflexota bacterium]